MALAQWERERFNYGEAAGDGKGDKLRIHGIKAEHAEKLVFSWLSGGASEVRLPDALPISRGGTGATTVAGILRTIGYFEDANHTLRRGVKVLSIGNTGMRDQFRNVPDATFSRESTGVYKITGITMASTLWGVVLPKDVMGFPVIIPTINTDNSVVTITVNAADYTTWPPKAGVLMDLPVGTQIDIEVA